MEKSQFRKPLIQSAAILGAVFILFALISSSTTGGTGGGILAIIAGIGNLILFFIGLAIAIPFSIAVIIAIFLGAVALYSKETSTQMYSDLKKNFSENIVTLKDKWSCCNDGPRSTYSEEETNQMKQGIVQLEENSVALQEKIQGLTSDNINLSDNLKGFKEQNSGLKEQLDELGQVVENLQNSNEELNELVSALSAKIDDRQDVVDLKDKISKMELLQSESSKNLEAIAARINSLETDIKQSPTAGIFSYIESDDDQTLFTTKVGEAVSQDMTYAQIDDYLAENLTPELDKIIKDHPSLTKTYIRNLRRE